MSGGERTRHMRNDPATIERGDSDSPSADEPKPGMKGDDVWRLNEGNGQTSQDGDYLTVRPRIMERIDLERELQRQP
jgi:hypothetical protein